MVILIYWQLLTNDGWSPAFSIESVLLQVFMAISSTDPFPAKLAHPNFGGEYGVGEAIEAYIRACERHSWKVPEGFKQMALGGQDSVPN
jgi:ubiquitin-conjugating enzyme E2 Q